MRAWLRDMGEVIRQGWWLIALFWGTGLVGAVQQSARTLYTDHVFHWPSPWWVTLFLGGFVIAQQLVIRERRPHPDRHVPPPLAMEQALRIVQTQGQEVASITHTAATGERTEVVMATEHDVQVTGNRSLLEGPFATRIGEGVKIKERSEEAE